MLRTPRTLAPAELDELDVACKELGVVCRVKGQISEKQLIEYRQYGTLNTLSEDSLEAMRP